MIDLQGIDIAEVMGVKDVIFHIDFVGAIIFVSAVIIMLSVCVVAHYIRRLIARFDAEEIMEQREHEKTHISILASEYRDTLGHTRYEDAKGEAR